MELKILNRVARAGALGALAALAASAVAQQDDLTNLSLSDLMRIEVVSASKRPQDLVEIPASVFVVTGEDIRRSGARSIPEALRLVPGVQVAQQNAGTWYVGIRGFSGRFSNKLLVLVDGRSVYTPLFSGVYWDALDVPLEDIDRIEVIRGPGGAVWGANAVNGVINIVTRSAEDTQGGLLTAGSGTQERGFGTLRYGGTLGDQGTYRVFAKATEATAMERSGGSSADDGFRTQHIGLRADTTAGARNQLTVTAGVFMREWSQATLSPVLGAPYVARSVSDQQARHWYTHLGWDHESGPSTKTSVLGNFEHSDRDMPEIGSKRTTWSLDVQQSTSSNPRERWVWGAGFRRTSHQTDGTFLVTLDPADRTDELWSGFVSDEIALSKQTHLTLGAKLERNGFTGWELQPSVRVAHQPSEDQTLWVAVSRAVRTPSRIDRDGRINFLAMPGQGGAPVLVALFGNDRFVSEKLTSREVGWRRRISNSFTLDVSAYHNVYSDLRSFEPGPQSMEGTPPPPHVLAPYTFANNLKGTTQGFEIVARGQPTPRWNLLAGLAWYEEDLELATGSMDPFGTQRGDGRGLTPRKQFILASQFDLGASWQLDSDLSYVDSIQEAIGQVDPYWRWNLRLGWSPSDTVSVGLSLRNLLDDRHEETRSTFLTGSSVIPRSAILQATWRF